MIQRIASRLMCVLLASCGTQIQFSCPVPSCVGLSEGSSLTIQKSNSDIGREIQETLTEELRSGGFYLLSPTGDYVLKLTDSEEYTWSKSASNPIDEYDTQEETEVETRVELLSRKGDVYGYSRTYSVTSDGWRGDIETLCHNIAQDLQPHRLIYTEKLYSPDHNPIFEKALDCSRRGAWQLARQHALQATLQTPGEPEVHYLMGLIERQLGNYAAAATCFRKACQLRPDSRYETAIAINQLMEMGVKNVRFQLRLKKNAPFNPRTLPAYHKPAGLPWNQVFFPLNLQSLPQ